MGKLSNSVDENRQGQLQGVNQSLQSISNIIVPLGAATVYLYSPDVLYLTAAIIILFSAFVYKSYLPR